MWQLLLDSVLTLQLSCKRSHETAGHGCFGHCCSSWRWGPDRWTQLTHLSRRVASAAGTWGVQAPKPLSLTSLHRGEDRREEREAAWPRSACARC